MPAGRPRTAVGRVPADGRADVTDADVSSGRLPRAQPVAAR